MVDEGIGAVTVMMVLLVAAILMLGPLAILCPLGSLPISLLIFFLAIGAIILVFPAGLYVPSASVHALNTYLVLLVTDV
ncbi:hypothetical protein Q3G72_007589 [Acer saccharum]|nr:hypothetical protein Q3G72_007589 [Acer saccharum]